MIESFGVQNIGWKDSKLSVCKYGAMLYSKHDVVIGKALSLYGEFAESENILMRKFVSVGDIVLDVGANIGTVSLALADAVGHQGQVIAFEAQKTIYQYLCANLVLNNYTQVNCHNIAAGRKSGTISVPDINYDKPSNFGAVRLENEGGNQIKVLPIDDLNLSNCQLIKVDVEGMELEVFEGATKTIESFRPVVYTENKSGPNSEKLISFFQKRDYRLYWHFASFFNPKNYNNNQQNVFGGMGDINMLCVPKEHSAIVNLPEIQLPSDDWKPAYENWLSLRR